MFDIKALKSDLERIASVNPLVLNITNYVVTNTTANALLAIGASPIMSFAKEEAGELVSLSSSLVINLGTLNKSDIEVMKAAWQEADNKPLPVLLDPVGAGASKLRTETAHSLLDRFKVSVIRGNASEIMTLAGEAGAAKGVDSTRSSDAALCGAKALAQVYGCVTCISGAEDLITDGSRVCRVRGGHSLMPLVTGLGCTATAVCGAFAAVNPDPLAATVHGMAAMAIAGERAADSASGPGTYHALFLDALHELTVEDLPKKFQVSTEAV